MQHIGKFVEMVESQADDLCYNYGILLTRQIEGSIKSLNHALAEHAPLDKPTLKRRLETLQGEIQNLYTWADNYYQDKITDKPNREYLRCKD